MSEYNIPDFILEPLVSLNVGGVKYQVLWSTLDKFPGTRLGQLRECLRNGEELRKICDGFHKTKASSTESDAEFFFNRHFKPFSSILNYYITGKLHLLDDICPLAFSKELEYWGINEALIEHCCIANFLAKKEAMEGEAELMIKQATPIYQFKFLEKFRRGIWKGLEESRSSKLAMLVQSIIVFFILLSTVVVVLHSLPELQEYECTSKNETVCSPSSDTIGEDWIPIENSKLVLLEIVCLIVFTIEYLIRLGCYPTLLGFIRDPLTWTDFCVLQPFYMSRLTGPSSDAGRVFIVFRLFRLMQIVSRILCLNSPLGFKLFGKSCKELFQILVVFASMTVIFANLVYFAEREENPVFESIPVCFWWAVITMTTVGYGDMYPVTSFGQKVGMLCSVSGVLIVIALPVAVISRNYAKEGERLEKNKKTKKRMKNVLGKKKKEIMLAFWA